MPMTRNVCVLRVDHVILLASGQEIWHKRNSGYAKNSNDYGKVLMFDCSFIILTHYSYMEN